MSGINLATFLFVQPLQKYLVSGGVKDKRSHSVVCQRDLNKMQIGPVFSPTTNTAEMLLLTFFAMTFAAGIPIMMPLIFLAYVIYFFMDKMLFIHYYKTPAHLDDGVTRVILSAMPWAAIIRCAFSCWMYGNENLFYGMGSSSDGSGAASSATDLSSDFLDQSVGDFSVRDRLTTENAFPLLVLLVLIIAMKLVAKVYNITPLRYIIGASKWFQSVLTGGNKVKVDKTSG